MAAAAAIKLDGGLHQYLDQARRAAEDTPLDFWAHILYAQGISDLASDAHQAVSDVPNIVVAACDAALKCVDLTRDSHMLTTYCYYLGCFAGALEAAGEYDRAQSAYVRILTLKPDDPQAIGNFAVFLHRVRKDYDGAEVYFKHAVALFPEHASILTKYAGFLKNVRMDIVEAERYLVKAVEVSPDNPDVLGAYAVFLHGQRKDHDKAETLYKQAVAADPDHPNILSNYGLFLSEVKRDFGAAEEMYQRGLKVEPQHANCLYNYAVLFDTGLKDPVRAEELYRRALASNPLHGYALYNLAILIEQRSAGSETAADAPAEIKSLFARAVEAAPDDVMALTDYGRFLLQRAKDVDGAEEVLGRALVADPRSVQALYYMGLLMLNERGDKTEAEFHLRTCLLEDRTHVDANHCLARLLAADKSRRASADGFFKKALDSEPDRTEILLEYSQYLLTSRKQADKERGKELYKQYCELTSKRVDTTVANTVTIRGDWLGPRLPGPVNDTSHFADQQ